VITEEDEDKAAMEYSIGLAETAEKQDAPKAKEDDEDEDIEHLDIAEQILNNKASSQDGDESETARPISEEER
tara:strand:- start:144 stop:362 length:219 start_codon:yes stop_codon:yes gene_type:complete